MTSPAHSLSAAQHSPRHSTSTEAAAQCQSSLRNGQRHAMLFCQGGQCRAVARMQRINALPHLWGQCSAKHHLYRVRAVAGVMRGRRRRAGSTAGVGRKAHAEAGARIAVRHLGGHAGQPATRAPFSLHCASLHTTHTQRCQRHSSPRVHAHTHLTKNRLRLEIKLPGGLSAVSFEYMGSPTPMTGTSSAPVSSASRTKPRRRAATTP